MDEIRKFACELALSTVGATDPSVVFDNARKWEAYLREPVPEPQVYGVDEDDEESPLILTEEAVLHAMMPTFTAPISDQMDFTEEFHRRINRFAEQAAEAADEED